MNSALLDLQRWILEEQNSINKKLAEEPISSEDHFNEGYSAGLVDCYNKLTRLVQGAGDE
jgi:hypothetical protein